ncbi:MAG: imidazole glycerol phosphate synthase subunit HisF, partial [Planctomycetes bacterium]|nr:imidazole glycerol phosphate synthase subunit HisF [Planctomycetota bacterium]
WAKRAEELGAGEICLNSIDADGTRDGYELTATRMVSRAVEIPVIASGGAGTSEHLARVLTDGEADAALIASMVHFLGFTIAGIKDELAAAGIRVRLETGNAEAD